MKMNMLEKLDYLMSEKGINKSQLAAQTGIPKTTVYGWYTKGYEGIRRPTLQSLANFFGVTMEYLTNDNIELTQTEKPATNEDDGLNLSEQDKSVIERFKNLSYENKLKMIGYLDSLSDQDNQ